MDNISLALPEIFLLSATSAVLVISLFLKHEQRTINYWLAQGSLLITLLLAFSQLGDAPQTAFSAAYGVDAMASSLKCWMILVAMGGFLYARDYLTDRRIAEGEYYTLGLFGVMGMMIMASAQNLITVYLGLELLALSQYAMVALYRSNGQASEAAMKYFVLGALASGMLLYGISMVYGATGTLSIEAVSLALTDAGERSVGARFGLVFIIVGLAFKFGAVPFHMWVPDVYEGAPTPVALYISTAPKMAAFAMTIRLLVDSLETLNTDWQQMLVIMSALSMIVGNLVAIAQTNIKRMLAYSTISHVGFLMMGMVSAHPAGYSASMFYAITYAFTTLAAFGVLCVLSNKGEEAVMLDDLTGLARRNKLLAAVMMLAMVSLAGVPPMVGFYAKFMVLQAALSGGYLWLALVGVAMSVVGAYYYLRVIKLMYFDEPIHETEVSAPMDVSAGLAVNGLAVLVLGVFPGLIMGACVAAFAS